MRPLAFARPVVPLTALLLGLCSVVPLASVAASTTESVVAREKQGTPMPLGPPRDPSRDRFGAARCTASEPTELGTSDVRTLRPHITFASADAGLVAWPTGEDTLVTRAIEPARVGPPFDVTLDQAVGLAALRPAGARGFIAIAAAPICDRRGHSCVRARALSLRGEAIGVPHEPTPSDQWATVTATTVVGDAVAAGLAFRYGGRIDLFRIDASEALVVESHPLRTECTGEALVSELAADGASLVALGSSDCSAPARFLLEVGRPESGIRRQPIRVLPQDSTVERFSVDGSIATLVFRAGRLRPRFARLSLRDGSVIEPPTTLSGALPPDLAAIVVPRIAIARGRLVLTRHDLAGTAIGEPFEIATSPGRVVIASGWNGEELSVVWASRSVATWRLWLRRVRCAGNP